MVNIDRLIGQVKDDLRRLLEPATILEQCRAAGHRWRSGPLNPATLVHLFVIQILHGNIACSALRHHSDRPFSVSAYCQARRRLPLAVIEALARRVAQVMERVCDQQGLWHGHRLWRVDGTGVSMPDTPELRDHFGQSKKQSAGCGFPVASLVVRVHAGTGMLLDMIVGPLVRHEMACAAQLHPKMRAGDVLVGDRGYCSYAHLALLLQGKMHTVLRLHQRIKTSFKPGRPCALDLPQNQRRGVPNSRVVRRHGRDDQVVTYFKRSSMKPGWMSREAFDALPEEIEVRELRYRIRRRGFRTRTVILATTLTDAETYPAEELHEVYGDRWQIEVDLRSLKISLGMDVLHCKSVEGVTKELWMFVLVYNLVRLVMLEAAHRQKIPVDRISFVDAWRHLRWRGLGELLMDLLVNPHRPGRVEPRVIKRRIKRYPLMTQPRAKLRQATGTAEATD